MVFTSINQITNTTATGNPAVDMVVTVAVTEFIMRPGITVADKIAAKNRWYERELRRAYSF